MVKSLGRRGSFVHANALNIHQLKTVMYLKFPHINEKVQLDDTSSHLDILPTLLDYLSSYHDLNFTINQSNGGMSLLRKLPKDRITFSASQNAFIPGSYSYNIKDKVMLLNFETDYKEVLILKSFNNFLNPK